MNDKLTVEQVHELVAFHNKVISGKGQAQPVTGRLLDPDEAAKLLPGMVMDYKVRSKRRPSKDISQE